MNATFDLFDNVFKKSIEIMLVVKYLDKPEETERRLNVCKRNAGICYDAKKDRCLSCTCYMTVKTKMLKHKNPLKNDRIEITHCPLAKWGADLSEKEFELEKEIANKYRILNGEPLLK